MFRTQSARRLFSSPLSSSRLSERADSSPDVDRLPESIADCARWREELLEVEEIVLDFANSNDNASGFGEVYCSRAPCNVQAPSYSSEIIDRLGFTGDVGAEAARMICLSM